MSDMSELPIDVVESFGEGIQQKIQNIHGDNYGLSRGKGAFNFTAEISGTGAGYWRMTFRITIAEAVSFKGSDIGYSIPLIGEIDLTRMGGKTNDDWFRATFNWSYIPLHVSDLRGLLYVNPFPAIEFDKWELMTSLNQFLGHQIAFTVQEFNAAQTPA